MNSWKYNNILLNNKWVNKKAIEKSKKFLELKGNEDIINQSFCDTLKNSHKWGMYSSK